MFGRKRNRYLILAAKRLDKIEKALAITERMAKKVPAGARARELVTELKQRRARFKITIQLMRNHVSFAESRMMKLGDASSASWSAFYSALVKSRKAFARANRSASNAIKRAVK